MAKILIFTSVIGGGHVFRDVAIARALQAERPDLDIVFASGGNAFEMLQDEGLEVERIAALRFPAHMGTARFFQLYMAILWSEVLQLQDLRRLMKKHKPDLVVLDEFFFLADYCRLKKVPVVFMCDFVGVPQVSFWQNPVRAGLERFFDWFLASWLPRRVGRWIYIGEPGLIPEPGWQQRAEQAGILSVGSITKLQYSPPLPRAKARAQLGAAPEVKVVTVAVGCSGVGDYLLESAIACAQLVHKALPGARFELICGKGIDPEPLAKAAGPHVRVHGYVQDIQNFYAASDAVVLQCGLTTTMECLQLGLPMVIVPLAGHWEQANTARFLRTQGARCIFADVLSPQGLCDELLPMLQSEAAPVDPKLPEGHVEAAKAILGRLTAM